VLLSLSKLILGAPLKKKSLLKILFFLSLLFLVSFSSQSKKLTIISFAKKNYVSQKEFVTFFNLANSFDLFSQKGKIFYKNHYATYKENYSYLLLDGKLIKSFYPSIRNKGEILLPLCFAKEIIKAFYPDLKIKEQGSSLFFEHLLLAKKKPKKRKKEKTTKRSSSCNDKITFIIIDPGHGGKDPGAIGARGIKEKNITLKVALLLKNILKRKTKNIKIKLTREKDKFIELTARTDLANKFLKKNNNGLFISIHVNASLSSKTSGFETYFLSQNPSNEDARNTATLENDVITLEKKGPFFKKSFEDINYLEAMMLTTQIQKESTCLAEAIQKNLDTKIKKFKSRGVRKADFFVLRGALMPAALVEIGFITNKKERTYLLKGYYQKKIAEGISKGICSFLKKYNSLQEIH